MNKPSEYDKRRWKADRQRDYGYMTEAEHKAEVERINREEQAEIRALQNAVKQSRLNR